MTVEISRWHALDEDHTQCVLQGLRNIGAGIISINYNGLQGITVWAEHEPGLPDETIVKAIETAMQAMGLYEDDEEEETADRPVYHS